MESEQKRARWRGKYGERRIAKLVNGVVVGRSKTVKVGDQYVQVNPQQPPDVLTPVFSIEVKYLKRLPATLNQAMAQSIRNAPSGKTPLTWFIGREDKSCLVVWTERDFLEWHVGSSKK